MDTATAPQCLSPSSLRRCAGALLAAWLSAVGVQAARAGNTSPYLFGDWHGARSRLADRGVDFSFKYTSEVAHNDAGGTRPLTRYADQWELGAAFDLDKLWGWRGARFEVTMNDRNGRDLDADAQLGTYQQVQEVYGRGQTWHLALFALTWRSAGGRFTWRVGRLPADADFDVFPCDFQNLSFCDSPPGRIVGDYWMDSPVSTWAAVLDWRSGAHSHLKLGAYQVNPHYTDDHWARANGWKPAFPGGTTGALVPLEYDWSPRLRGLPGSYRIGAWYNTAGGADLYYDADREPIALTGGPALRRSARSGGYLTIQQQVSGEPGGRGTTLFLNLTLADADTSATDGQYALGVEYKGAFGRPRDAIGAAIGATHGSHRLAARQRLYDRLHPAAAMPVQDGSEYVAELFYGWSPLAALTLRPNLQYVLHPGGTARHGHALVLGLKTLIAF